MVRDHISWQFLPKRHNKLLHLCLSCIEKYDFLCLFIINTACAVYALNPVHMDLDLAEFYPVTHVLDLIILSGDKHKFPAFIYFPDISGTIDQFMITVI